MTRKDYELIAHALWMVRGSGSKEGSRQWERTIYIMTNALAQDNPRFDREKFLKACGI